MKTREYRFDNAYQKIYKYDEEQQAYLFFGSYFAYGITNKDRYYTAVSKINNNN